MSLVNQLAPHASGLEQLQMMLAKGMAPEIAKTLGVRLARIGKRLAGFEGTPDERAYNPIGMVHGGYAATLLDSACGCAVHSMLTAEQAYTTLELKVSYHKAITSDTGLVRAEGKVLSIGRRAAFAEARLTNAEGRLLASATSTLLV